MNIAIDVARGLSFLHSLDANVIYRDLKASNILLDSVYMGTCEHLYSIAATVHEIHLANRVVNDFYRISMPDFRILA